jgi:hypothetical protein
LVGREFAFCGNPVWNADSDQNNDDDTSQQYCEVIRPAILSEVRAILRLSGGRDRIGGRLSIPSETQSIGDIPFKSHWNVREVVFGAHSRCRTIDGFRGFTSLVRIEIASSVEVIGPYAFYGCPQLREVIFEANHHLRVIKGFRDCTALSRIAIPSSVESRAGVPFIPVLS